MAQEISAGGERVRFLDMKRVGQDVLLTHSIGTHRAGDTEIYVKGEAPICLKEVRSVWYRRPAAPKILASVLDPDDHSFARKEWLEAINGLLMCLDARFINSPLAQSVATKPRQLEVALRVGLDIPDTLITNNPDQVEMFLQTHQQKVIHKALTAPPDKFIDTRRWVESDRAELTELPIAPVIFQAEVVGLADVRANIVGERIFAARIATCELRAGIDSRLDLDIPYEPHELPEEVHRLLLQFMQEMGLVFGTVDMKISEEGNYVFLEVNPQGQFLYVEILTGMPITTAVAELLTRA